MAPQYTTRPIIPPYSELPVIKLTNPNLYLRAVQVSDLAACHELRTQFEVMKYTSQTRIDADLDATRTWMARFCDMDQNDAARDQDIAKVEVTSSAPSLSTLLNLDMGDIKASNTSAKGIDSADSTGARQSGHQRTITDTSVSIQSPTQSSSTTSTTTKRDTFSFALVYREPEENDNDVDIRGDETLKAATSTRREKFIGSIGCHTVEPEAECGYMINKHYWGKGFATQAMKAFLAEWYKLPRILIEVPSPSTQREEATSDNTVSTTITIATTEDSTDSVAASALEKADPGTAPSLSANETNSNSRADNIQHPGDNNEVHHDLIPESIKAIVESSNIASMKVLEKLGFKYVDSEEIEENGGTVILKQFALKRRIPDELVRRF